MFQVFRTFLLEVIESDKNGLCDCLESAESLNRVIMTLEGSTGNGIISKRESYHNMHIILYYVARNEQDLMNANPEKIS